MRYGPGISIPFLMIHTTFVQKKVLHIEAIYAGAYGENTSSSVTQIADDKLLHILTQFLFH